jgi:hypothetical protein
LRQIKVAIKISDRVLQKLAAKVPPVTREEVEQCFANRAGGLLEDAREQHKTEPPTQWFIAETDRGRRLKVVFVQDGADVDLKTAYDPNRTEMLIYLKYGGNLR